jgi:hypothetical protein
MINERIYIYITNVYKYNLLYYLIMIFRSKNGELFEVLRSHFNSDKSYYSHILSLKTNNNYPKSISTSNRQTIINIING